MCAKWRKLNYTKHKYIYSTKKIYNDSILWLRTIFVFRRFHAQLWNACAFACEQNEQQSICVSMKFFVVVWFKIRKVLRILLNNSIKSSSHSWNFRKIFSISRWLIFHGNFTIFRIFNRSTLSILMLNTKKKWTEKSAKFHWNRLISNIWFD